ncbi:MAG: hypothetical protein V2I33_20325 [Kangiellaceae bacterium]|jgi:hypothetical protein|nr:hypothetical protein [Kangiellaceae bacterium]
MQLKSEPIWNASVLRLTDGVRRTPNGAWMTSSVSGQRTRKTVVTSKSVRLKSGDVLNNNALRSGDD